MNKDIEKEYLLKLSQKDIDTLTISYKANEGQCGGIEYDSINSSYFDEKYELSVYGKRYNVIFR